MGSDPFSMKQERKKKYESFYFYIQNILIDLTSKINFYFYDIGFFIHFLTQLKVFY